MFNQKTSIDDITLDNYRIPYRCDRVGRVGGDVAIYVKENIYSEEKVELKQNGLESIWMKILTKGVAILFGLLYRPPDSENYIWDHINHSIDLVLNTSIDRIVICGDFNEYHLNPRKMQIKNICLQNNLVQIINNPTFYCSLLDLVIINDPDIVIY